MIKIGNKTILTSVIIIALAIVISAFLISDTFYMELLSNRLTFFESGIVQKLAQ